MDSGSGRYAEPDADGDSYCNSHSASKSDADADCYTDIDFHPTAYPDTKIQPSPQASPQSRTAAGLRSLSYQLS